MILADDGAISVTYGQLSSALIQYYPTQEMVRSLHIHRVIDKDRYICQVPSLRLCAINIVLTRAIQACEKWEEMCIKHN